MNTDIENTTDKKTQVEKAWKITFLLTWLAAAILTSATNSMAVTLPTAGYGYDIYDFVVNQGLKGPFGIAGGIGLIIYGFVQVAKHPLLGVPSAIAGIGILKADTIVQSFGINI